MHGANLLDEEKQAPDQRNMTLASPDLLQQ
jgi:hypothetical protein